MINPGMMSSDSMEWGTPSDLFNEWNKIYNFGLDACASEQNAKCKTFFSLSDDGLSQSWQGFGPVWCNPPYGRTIGKWVEKCFMESSDQIVVALLPARTDTKWFHRFIYHGKAYRMHFLNGRVKFIRADGKTGPAPFPSMIVVWAPWESC